VRGLWMPENPQEVHQRDPVVVLLVVVLLVVLPRLAAPVLESKQRRTEWSPCRGRGPQQARGGGLCGV